MADSAAGAVCFTNYELQEQSCGKHALHNIATMGDKQ